MKNTSKRKVVNVDKPNHAPIFEFKQLDNVVLKLSLFKDSVEFDITGQTLKLGAKTNDGLKEQTEGFTINRNNLDIDLKNSILVPGEVEIDLELKDASGAMTTASFFIIVKSKVLNDKAVEGTNEFDTFTKTAAKIEEDYKGLRRIIIDENQAANLQDQVNQTNAQLDNKANKNEVFSMANMGQDIKEAMTGGSVAIVGRNTILNENIVDNQITNNKLSDENFVCVYNDFENLSSNTDTNGNWCNNFVYEKGFVKSIKVKINGEITQQGKIYLYEKLENGNIIYRKEYDINGVGYVIIPVNENIEYDFMLSTKCANVGYAYLEIGVKSADLGGTTTEFSPKFNENYIFSIGVNYDGIVNRLKKVEETTNNLNINNLRYSKLKYCALGDSITKGENSLNGYNAMIGERYTDLAQEYFGFRETVNLGKGGSRITRHTQDGDTKYGMIDRLDTIPWDTDILCVFGGTNDFGNNVKIGTIDSYDYTNFKFCVNEIIKTTLSHYPNIKMYFITPIHRNDWLADNIPNAVGHTLKDYVDTIKEVCEMYGIPVLDLWSIYGISPFIESQRSMFMPDGLHPIPLGMKRLAELNNKFIENMF